VSIYIEDTDAQAVVYYANYLRFFERAAYSWVGTSACGTLLRQGQLLGIEALDVMKYAEPALLGDVCEVRGEFTGMSGGALSLRIALVRCSDDKELCSCARLELAFRDAEGSVAPAWPLPGSPVRAAELSELPELAGLAVPADPTELAADLPVVLHADEAGGQGRLTLHAALRYFERHRTSFIGGPDALAGLQKLGTNVVVARLSQGRLLPAAGSVWVGDPLTLRCRCTLRARGTQVLFEQFLFTGEGEGEGEGELVACAAVTCLCIDPVAGKMVAAPKELQAQLMSVMGKHTTDEKER